MKKILAMLLVIAMVLSMVACGSKTEETQPSTVGGNEEVVAPTDPADEVLYAELKSLNNKEYGVDYVSLYSKFGEDVTIDMVVEDPATGNAYIELDGTMYTLGLDFLSRAMV